MVGNIYKNKIRIRYLGISLVLPDLVYNVGEGKCFPQVVPADDTTNLGIKGTIKLNFGFFSTNINSRAYYKTCHVIRI